MKKLGIVIILISIVVLVSSCRSQSDNIDAQPMPEKVNDEAINNNENADDSGSMMKENIIEFTSEGYTPEAITIKQGDKVTWVNKLSEETWPASAMHPTHKVYPGSDIEKCGTAEENNIFDACRSLGKDESYSFVFNEKGNWKYHDHLNIKYFGSITVE